MGKKVFCIFESILITVISYIILSIPRGDSIKEFFFNSIFSNKKMNLITLFLLLIVFLFLISITNSLWRTTSIMLSLSVLISIVGYEKMSLRSEGLLPSDFLMLKSIGKILSMINIKTILLFLVIIILIIILSYFILRKSDIRIKRNFRIGIILISLFIFWGIGNFNQKSSIFHKPGLVLNKVVNNNPMYFDPIGAVYRNGLILNFINNFNVETMERPINYSKATVNRIVKKYQLKSKKINESRYKNDQIVIFILSESFSNPADVPEVSLNKNPIPYTESLIKNGVGGKMLSDGLGGGTANMEYQSLTGLSLGNFSATLPTPYTQLVIKQKYVNSITKLFDSSLAIHPYYGNLYNRTTVFKKMGFNKFDYLGHNYPKKYIETIGKNPYVSDISSYKYLLSNIKSDKKIRNQFIQLSTMQNHMPYDKKYSDNFFKVNGKFSNNEKSEIKNYSYGINKTDEANEFLIEKLKKIKRDVAVVFYGDHLPGLYQHVNLNKHGVVMHETPYFIWSNHNKLNKTYHDGIVGTYSFPSRIFQSVGIKIPPFYALLQDVDKNLPIIGSKISNANFDPNFPLGNRNLVDIKSNKIISSKRLNKKQKKLLNDYEIIQYDLTVGKHYSDRESFMTEIQ